MKSDIDNFLDCYIERFFDKGANNSNDETENVQINLLKMTTSSSQKKTETFPGRIASQP